MKNRYGFTLIEILAIIALLAVLTLVTAPTIIRLYKSDSKKEYDEYLETLELATESYIKSNIDKYPQLKTPGGSANISIGILRKEGFVKKNLINPKTKSNTLDTDGFKVTTKSDKTFKYEWINGLDVVEPTPSPTPKPLLGGEYIINKGIVTTGDGLYKDTTSSGGYVYKGNNPSNFMIFNNKCWSIIRIEKDNKIKIIYEGEASNNTCSRSVTNGSVGEVIYNSNTSLNPVTWGHNNTMIRLALEKIGSGNAYNGFYLQDLSNVDNHTWNMSRYYGNLSSSNKVGIEELLDFESGLSSSVQNESWKNKIGLLSVSDYIKATLNTDCNSLYSAYQYGEKKCDSNNYLYKDLDYYFGLASSFTLWHRAYGAEGLNKDGGASNSRPLRIVLYLNSNAKLTGDGTSNSPFKLETTKNKYRYVRDYISGNTINDSNHWVEIEVYDKSGNLISKGKNVTANFTPVAGTSSETADLKSITDGIKTATPYLDGENGTKYVEVDLGAEYEIGKVIVWHYYDNQRKYHSNKTILYNSSRSKEVNIFDSNIEGEYIETSSGHTINIIS